MKDIVSSNIFVRTGNFLSCLKFFLLTQYSLLKLSSKKENSTLKYVNLTIKTRSQKTETVVRRCSFLGQLDSRMPVECFPLPYDLSGFKSKIDGHLFRFFINRFPAGFNLFVLIFLLTPCLVVSLQPCSEWTPVKKK